jgi:hypothetical protein
MTTRRVVIATAALAAAWGGVRPVHAASHLWYFNEIFSNPDRTIQFIELKECCGATAERGLSGKWIKSDANAVQFNFPGNLSGNTANRHLLLATAGFAALPGAPTPDYIIPSGFFPLNTANTLRYWLYSDPGSTMSYASGAVPTDGVTSLSWGGATGVNSPTNYSGATGSVNAAPCVDNDSDGYGSPGAPLCPNGAAEDCNDGDGAINPGATESCADEVDNNCDGNVDCDDPDCASFLACIPTVSQWGLLVLTLATLIGGAMVLRRRSAAAA